MNEFKPNWVSAPGDTIRDLLLERRWRDSDTAPLLGMDLREFEDLLSGKMRIDRGIASLLASTFGSTVEFWLTREEHYREGLKSGLPKA